MNKKLTIFVFALISALAAYSQNRTVPDSFIFLNNKDSQKEAFYKKSIEAANMESFRLKNQRVKLVFENSFEIEMLSAAELYRAGKEIVVGSYPENFPSNYKLPVFNILESGQLMSMYPNDFKIKQ